MTRKTKSLGVGLSVLLLSACSSLVTPYQRPEAPVAAQFKASSGVVDVQGTSRSRAADIAWQSYFNDPQLNQLITAGIQSNKDLRIAILQIEQSKAQLQIRRADQWPTVNFGVANPRQSVGSSNSGDASAYNVGLAVTAFELDLFRRVANLNEAGLAQYLATQEGQKTVQINLVASIASTYLSLMADQELLEITRQTMATRQTSFELAQLRFRNGVISDLDLQSTRSLLEAANFSLAQQKRQRQLNVNALTLLVGKELVGPLSVDSVGPLSGFSLQAVPEGLPSDLLERRPDIKQAEQQLIAANANIGGAKAAFFPRIALTGSAGTVSSRLSDLFKGGFWGWTITPQLLLPIFDGGRNSANLAVSKAAEGIAVATYQKSIQTAFKEVSDALAGSVTYAEQLRAAQAQSDAETKRYRLADLRYRNGVASQLDQLDSQRSVFATQQAVVQTKLNQLQGQVALYKALGGGWKD